MQTPEIVAAVTAPTLGALCAAMPDAYEPLEGVYTSLPTWGEEDAEVKRRIAASCDSGDIVSWDTRAEPHRYLVRRTDAGRQVFEVMSAGER